MAGALHIALAGNPNAGKTTLFNYLTGARQHVGNYPGVTVEKKEGIYLHKGTEIRVVDLPGTYSLTAYSVEELVARDYLVNERPDVVVNIVDASNLERNLYLSCQFLELGVPLVIALNMIDVAEKRGIHIDTEKLSELTGVPVLPIIARNGKGVPELLEAVQAVSRAATPPQALLRYGADIDQALSELIPIIEQHNLLGGTYPARWTALKVLESDDQIVVKLMEENLAVGQRLIDRSEALARHLQDTLEVYPETVIADHRYGFVRSILRQGEVTRMTDQDRLHASDQIDKVVTHRLAGPLLMAAVLFALYSFTFNWSGFLVDRLGLLFEIFGNLTETMLPDGPIKSMLISGVIDGVGGVLGFVPIIMFMFFGIAVLEDSGYLARVAFMMDRIFHFFGLHGSSVMPFIISGGIAGGCAVPGVMAARTLRSPKERMATLLTVPFMNCGAKLPVFALLIATFFERYEALILFLITLGAWAGALLVAKLLRITVIRGSSTPFVMELPPYRMPTFKGLAIHTWERTWQYIKKAGTVILGLSIVLWAMMTFPGLPESMLAEFEKQRQVEISRVPPVIANELKRTVNNAELSIAAYNLKQSLRRIDAAEAETALRYSIAGRIGCALETV